MPRWRWVTASDRDARRRLLLLVTAGVLGFVPPAALLVFVILRPVRIEGWAIGALLLMMLILPVTIYAIGVHRARDVRVVIRQGLQYALTRGGVRVAEVVLSALIVVAVASMTADAGAGLITRAALIAAGLAVVLFIGRSAERLGRWIDRRFFREAYEADEILGDLADKVRTMLETAPLLETVAMRVAESLHVSRIAVLLEGGGRFVPAYALGYTTPPTAAISDQSVTVMRLRKHQHALVRFDDAESWVQLTNDAERASLEQLESELLLPLSINEKILGIMSLGAKQSEEPFSKTDIRLLESLAAQTGLALENGRLTAAIAADVAAHAKEKRDLEIARDVQERLFPQEYPSIAGLDYAGACRSALFVGGDYYDFIALPNAHLGIAIADVSGKGIPAALLMATLRAYLRGAQMIHHQADLTEVMRNLNTMVYESSAANRYATFFYGEFDSPSRVLNYVNGGHIPPMLFRQSNGDRAVLRLDTGGPVIGLMEGSAYTQGRVTLERGDVLVAYTDGVSEAMNAADDEWGDEGVMQVVRESGTVSASTLIQRVIVAAAAFAAGAPQHDDMTMVVVRVL